MPVSYSEFTYAFMVHVFQGSDVRQVANKRQVLEMVDTCQGKMRRDQLHMP